MSVITSKETRGIIVDLFAGGGGASVGIEAATGRHVDIALNHDPIALAVHRANHPGTHHLRADVFDVNPRRAVQGHPVDILWASPDCTHFSVAKGGRPRKQSIRSLAWAVVRWARETKPRLIFIENVAEFQGWGPLDEAGNPIKARMGETFRRWKRDLESLGYAVDFRVLDASLYGAPTRRRRLFLVARCDGQPIRWPEPTHGKGREPLHTAAECIDWSLPCPSIFLTREEGRVLGVKRPLADATLRRLAAGTWRYVIDNPRPFIVEVAHGKDQHRTSSIDEPMTTVLAARRTKAIAIPFIANTRNGERHGEHGEQAPRVFDINDPFRTVTAQGSQGALVTAFLARHMSERDGGLIGAVPLDAPLPPVMTRNQTALTSLALEGFELPPGMVDRREEVAAFLCAFQSKDGGTDYGQSLEDPLRTVTTRDRYGLVTVQGRPIVDIGMRMLQPHELLRAQFGRFAESYDLDAAETKEDKVRLVGNSVCPEVAEAVVRANLTPGMDLYGQGDLFTGMAA